MRILYITTVGSTMDFFKSLIKKLIDEGNIVDVATNESEKPVSDCFKKWGCKVFQIPTSRSPFSVGNIRAIKQIKKIAESYDIVHCHTPLASAAARIACKRHRGKGLKVIYTAHGFHFYKGAPLTNWLIYYPVEWICAHWTDVLITINKEDYTWAKNHLRIKQIEYVPGVGIDVDKFANAEVDRKQKRYEVGIPEDAYLLLSVGELNENKNHQVVLKALSEVEDKNIHYAIAGKGGLHDYLLKTADSLGLKDRFHLLGYRNDINELYKIADAFVLPSIREGLNVSTMEALASGLLCIVSEIRGNVDMVKTGVNGYYVNPFDTKTVVESIDKCIHEGKSIDVGKTAGQFSDKIINGKMKEIYRSCYNA